MLPQTVQTTHFVQHWHQNSERLWNSQWLIDNQLESQSSDLQQAVLFLGDQLISLQQQVKLQCDWNITTFSVTPHVYNQSKISWDLVHRHLLNQGNTSADITQLQKDIYETFKNKLEMISGAPSLSEITNRISGLNPMNYIKPLRFSAIGILG